MAWITHPGIDDALAGKLLAPGLLPGEAVEHVSYGFTPVTMGEVARGAAALRDRAAEALGRLRARDVVAGAAGLAGLVVADSALHAFGSLEPHQSVADVGIVEREAGEVVSPPGHNGHLVALTSARLLLLDVWSTARRAARTGEIVHGYAVAGAWTWPRPLPAGAALRFEEKRVLWERQVELRAGTSDGERIVRFNGYAFRDASERARAIAASLGLRT